MRYFILIYALITIVPSFIVAQISQPHRYEIELGTLNDSFFTASAEENGLFIFKQNPLKNTVKENIWEVIWLDTDLQEKSKWELPINNNYWFKASVFSDNQLVLLFQIGLGYAEEILFVTYTINDDNLIVYKYDNLVPLVITHLEKKEEAVIFGGNIKNKTVVKLFNISQKEGSVLPGFYDRVSKLQYIDVNPANEFIRVITIEEQPDKSNNIVTRYFSKIGKLIETKEIKEGANADLTSVIGWQNDINTNIIAGTYSLDKPLLKSDGIFIANVEDPARNKNFYYNKFTDFEHFFSYKGEKREKRLKKKIARKKKRNRDLDMDFYIKVRDISFKKDENILLGEVYTPKRIRDFVDNGYNLSERNDMIILPISQYTGQFESNFIANGYNSIYRFDHLLPINNPNNIAGFKYTHAFIAGFDHEGNKVWDNSIITENLSNRQLTNFVFTANLDEKMVLLYLNDQQIYSKVIKENAIIKDKTSEPLRLYNEADVLNNSISYFEGLKKWHGNTFYAYGVNSVTNTKISVENERKVFFINKIVVE